MARAQLYVASTSFRALFSTPPPAIVPSLTIAANKIGVLEVPVVTEGAVRRLSVRQKTGSNVAYAVEVFNTDKLYPVATTYDDTDAPEGEALGGRVVPRQAVSSGATLELTGDYPYVLLDGTYATPARKLYVVVIPTASGGETTWDVALTITPLDQV